jgi:hypothetical protein
VTALRRDVQVLVRGLAPVLAVAIQRAAIAADDLAARVAEHPLRAVVPAEDRAVDVAAHDRRIGEAVEDGVTEAIRRAAALDARLARLEDVDDRVVRAGAPAYQRRRDHHAARVPLLVEDTLLDLVALHVARGHAPDEVELPLPVVGVGDLVQREPSQLLARVAEDRGRGVVEEHPAPVEASHAEADRRRREGSAQTLVAAAERLGGCAGARGQTLDQAEHGERLKVG